MDLDQHGTRSARQLRSQVETRLDVSAARAAVVAGSRRRARRRQAGFGATAAALIAVVALVAATAGTSRDGSGPASVRTNTGRPSVKGAPQSSAARGAALLRSVPAGPVDGKVSYRLPVVADPQSGLSDGDTIHVYGKGFEPGTMLGVVQCSSEADTESAGVAACQLADPPPAYPPGQDPGPMPTFPAGDPGGPPQDPDKVMTETLARFEAWIDAGGQIGNAFGQVTYVNASDTGTVDATVKVRRYIDTPAGGHIDCQSAAERCIVAVGEALNYDSSGGSYLQFADAPKFATPTLAVDPPGPYAPGQTVTARAAGMAPGRQVRLQQCRGDHCHTLANGRPDASGTFVPPVVLAPTVIDSADGSTITCDDRCELRVTLIGVAGATSAPVPDPFSITFTTPDGGPSPSPTTAPGTTGSFTPPSTTTAPTTTTTGPGFRPAG